MPKETHIKHHSQTNPTVGRLLLVVVFFILCAANYLLFEFSRRPGNPFPAMPGLVVGSALASTVIIGAIWIRKQMARTALVVFLWIMIFIFSMPGLIMMSDRAILRMETLQLLAGGLIAYLIANILLIVCAPIHRLGASRGCRG